AGFGALYWYHRRPGYRFTVENSVYVAPERQGRGVGKLLLAQLIDEAVARGLRAIIAAIADGNEASIQLHRRAGFQEVGRLSQVVYKFERWIDVVYMQRMLYGGLHSR